MGPLDLKCDWCGNIVSCKSYHAHSKTCHGEYVPLQKQCPWCPKKLNVPQITYHARKCHLYGEFSCKAQNCAFKGYFAKDLLAHNNEMHNEDVAAWCPLCRKDIPISKIVDHHEECMNEYVAKREEAKRREKETYDICETCGKVFKERKGYRNHLKKHLREEAAKGDNGIDEVSLYHYCDQCDKRYTSLTSVKVHILRDHDGTRFPCPTCDQVFDARGKLVRHKNKVHSTDKDYECKVCGRRFGVVAMRKKHELLHGEPRFQCKHCSTKLTTEKSLEEHEKFHTGERPFKCTLCGNGFVARKYLAQHMRGVHKILPPGNRGGQVGWCKSKSKGLKVQY